MVPSSERGCPQTNNLSMADMMEIVDPATLEMLHELQQQKRERQRESQRKYVKKQSRKYAGLETYTALLRDEVSQLQIRRNHLLSSRETLCSAAVEYFRIFENGLAGPEELQAKDLEFLSTVVAPDVDLGASTGFKALVMHWRTFTQIFPDVRIQLTSLEQIVEESLVANTITRITMTKQSLQDVFPRLVDDSRVEKHRRKRIVCQLLSQRIVMKGSVRFSWDSASRHVTKLYAHTDMLSPLLQLVGSLADAAAIFRDAAITPDCNLVITRATTQKHN